MSRMPSVLVWGAFMGVLGGQWQALVRGWRASVLQLITLVVPLREWFEQMPPRRLPVPVRFLVIVCRANLCRSPLAEVYMQARLEQMGQPITVASAGLEAGLARSVPRVMIDLAHEQGLDLSRHVTSGVSAELVQRADLILVMERTQKIRIVRLYPETSGKVYVLGLFDPHGSQEIADPYGKSQEEYERCFLQIRRSCEAVLTKLS